MGSCKDVPPQGAAEYAPSDVEPRSAAAAAALVVGYAAVSADVNGAEAGVVAGGPSLCLCEKQAYC